MASELQFSESGAGLHAARSYSWIRPPIIKQGRLIATETVEHLRASTPQAVQARFRQPVDRSLFAGIDGVSVTSCDGGTVQLEVTGAIGPVLGHRRPRPGRPHRRPRQPGRALPVLLPRTQPAGAVPCILTSPGSTCRTGAAA